MSPPEPEGQAPLDAGDFGAWLASVRRALAGRVGSEVPCGGCTACCTSSQFVDISRDETDTLAHIPPALLFPAPRRPGHLVLGYDENGRCPMLVDNRCSIYEHRPRACRVYDCRVFAAAGVDVEADKDLLARRVTRWRFRYAGPEDEALHRGVRAATDWLRTEAGSLPEGARPATATQLAVTAVAVGSCFVSGGATAEPVVPPDPRAVVAEMRRRLGAALLPAGGGPS